MGEKVKYPDQIATRDIVKFLGKSRKVPIPSYIKFVFGEGDTEENLWAGVEYLINYDYSAKLRLIHATTPPTAYFNNELCYANALLSAEYYYKRQRHLLKQINYPKVMMTDPEQLTLQAICRQAKRQGMIMVEVGSWMGGSTAIMGLEAEKVNGVVFAVDFHHWFGDGIFVLFREIMRNMKLWGKNVVPMLMPSTTAALIFIDEIADVIFIDASHDYQSILLDITRWFPKVRIGGILCGHDCDDKHPGIIKALKECFGENGYTVTTGTSIWSIKRMAEK